MRVAIVGVSDQGWVVLDILDALGEAIIVVAVIDSSELGELVGSRVGKHHVSFDLGGLDTFVGDIDGVVPAVGDRDGRRAIAQHADRLGLNLISVAHPAATIAPNVTIGRGTVVGAGARLGPMVSIGRGSIVNTGAVVEHHCLIGEFSHVGPGAVLAGSVRAGSGTWIGAGATVLDGIVIEDEAVVGAGAVVIRDVPAATTVVGVPAEAMGKGNGEDD